MTLFRERNGWCPYSERVWIAAEYKKLDYDTFLIDNMGAGRPSWFSGTTPGIRWKDGSQQGESLDIIYKLDEMYPNNSLQSENLEVKALISAFKATFPRNTRPSSRAAFLFAYGSDMPLFRSEFTAVLEKTDALLAQYPGPFFFGKHFTAADCAWAPFLERYAAQLPLLHAGLVVRDPDTYPHLCAWFAAMESAQVPFYASRIKGDSDSWTKVLAMQGYGNAGNVPILSSSNGQSNTPDTKTETQTQTETEAEAIWRVYANDRPYLAAHPATEAAVRVIRNSKAITADCVRTAAFESESQADAALRAACELLLQFVEEGRPVASTDRTDSAAAHALSYIAERICVPRDMGALSARAVYQQLEACKG
jgi:glutathione S-transferase